MNTYRLTVELGYFDEESGITNSSQQTFYIGSKNTIDFKYIKKFVYMKCGDQYDTLDFVVERISDNEKF